MCRKIDSGYCHRAVSVNCVTLAAKLPGRRLLWNGGAWRYQMLRLNVMASCTGQRFMRRDGFFIGNFAMTGAAILREIGRDRVVRIVTVDTGFTWIMRGCNYLRKSCWARWVIVMADWTSRPFSGNCRSAFIGRLRVLARRTMTDFTGKPFMIGMKF